MLNWICIQKNKIWLVEKSGVWISKLFWTWTDCILMGRNKIAADAIFFYQGPNLAATWLRSKMRSWPQLIQKPRHFPVTPDRFGSFFDWKTQKNHVLAIALVCTGVLGHFRAFWLSWCMWHWRGSFAGEMCTGWTWKVGPANVIGGNGGRSPFVKPCWLRGPLASLPVLLPAQAVGTNINGCMNGWRLADSLRCEFPLLKSKH